MAFALLTSAALARADAGHRAMAEALFQKGRAALSRGDLQAACSAFEESVRIEPAPGTMFNLADCEEKRGRLATAWQWFKEAGAHLSAGDQRHETVDHRVAALKPRVPQLTIRLAPTAPKNTSVSCDGIALGSASLGVPLPIDPGPHAVVATSADRADKKYSVSLSEGQQKELAVEPEAVPPAAAAEPPPAATAEASPEQPQKQSAPPPPPTEVSQKRGIPADAAASSANTHGDQRLIGYVVGGVGVASVGASLVLGVLALQKKGIVDDKCNVDTGSCRTTEAQDAASTGQTLSTASTITFFGGLAAIGVGAFLVLTGGDDKPRTALRGSGGPGGAYVSVLQEF